ncbi:hypothetical protein F5050DRAFT_1817629, partial [Lentinula boryana]
RAAVKPSDELLRESETCYKVLAFRVQTPKLSSYHLSGISEKRSSSFRLTLFSSPTMASPASRRSTASNSLILIESQGAIHSSTIITDTIKDWVRNVSPEQTSIVLKECESAAEKTDTWDEVVVQPRITNPERISSSGGNQPMITADFTIPMFQTRMRASNQVQLEFIAQGQGRWKENLGRGYLKIFASLNSGILSSSGSPYIEKDGSLVGTLEAILLMAEKPRKQNSTKRVAKAIPRKGGYSDNG